MKNTGSENHLRTIYPYGFDERAQYHDSKFPIGLFFTSVTNSRQRFSASQNFNEMTMWISFFWNFNTIQAFTWEIPSIKFS